MELVDIRDLFHHQEDYVGKKITVGGWVRSNRNSKNFGFIVVNDGTFFEPLQVVYADGLENFQELTKLMLVQLLLLPECWRLHRKQSSHLKFRQRKS